MSLEVEGLLLFALFVLPGVFARAEAHRAAPIPQDRVARSWIRDLADALAYSAAVAPLAGLVAVGALWALTGGALGLVSLAAGGLRFVSSLAPAQTLIAGLVYLYAGLALGGYLGASRAAARARAFLVDRVKLGEGLSDEPIWWSIFDTRAREVQLEKKWNRSDVAVNVHLAGGGRYTGILLYFPVVDDTEESKDFAIWKARYYAPNLQTEVVELDPDSVILLNTKDCLAIEVRYVERAPVHASSVPVATAPPSAARPGN